MTTPCCRRRFSLAGALAAASLAAGCAGGGAKPQPCATEEECPTGARCLEQVCVANAPPVAVVAAPAPTLQANALLSFDGSASHDPDAPRDSVVSYAWTFEAVDAPCPAPVVAGSGAQAVVRFACPGRYRVSLVVSDERSTASAPARRELAVSPHPPPALVAAVPDVVVGHRCAGEPLRCAPDAEVTLGATAPSAVGPVTYRWSAVPPPDRPLGAARRVTFVPGAEEAAPAAVIETDGAAISGDWTFVVEASDAAGSLGTAITRVSVGNSAPTLAGDLRDFPHRYDPGTEQFVVTDALDVAVVDPDGDPVPERTLTLRHAGDGGALFSGEDLGDRIAFTVIVPSSLGAPFLAGAPELSRTIELAVRDVNGASASAFWPVVIGNRPPVLAAAVPTATTLHGYDPAAQRYLASATLAAWSDPDGDPLVQEGDTGDPMCASFRILDGRAAVECALDFALGALTNFAREHVVAQRVRDPWVASVETTATRLAISNRAPQVAALTLTGATACAERPDDCCRVDPTSHECLASWTDVAGLTFRVAGAFADEDGDPLRLTASGTGVVTSYSELCAAPSCAIDVPVDPADQCVGALTDTATVSAWDGHLGGSAQISLTRTCAP